MSRLATTTLLALTTLQLGCFTGAEGRQPDPAQIYFPTGVLASPGGTALYVANSDFDLGFAGGSVQVLDLRALRGATRVVVDVIAAHDPAKDPPLDMNAVCDAAGVAKNPDEWLNPGPCAPFDVAPFVKSTAFIGAFASGLLLVHDPDAQHARLFVPVRGDPSITYFEVDDDREAAEPGGEGFVPGFGLDCQIGDDRFCNDAFRLGRDPDRNLRGVQLPTDPVGIAATADGRAIVTAHQTEASASLLINDWGARPELVFSLSNLANGPTEVATIPEPAFVALAREDAAAGGRLFSYRTGFSVTYRNAAEIDQLRYVPDSGAAPPRPFLVRGEAFPITTNASAFDSRGIALLDTDRAACEASCAGVADALGCNVACAEEIPVELFMANRDPAALLVGQLQTVVNRGEGDVVTGAAEATIIYDQIALAFGPSRVEAGKVVDKNGELVDRVFAVCFDSRSIYVIDPVAKRTEAVIHTGRGPHDVGFDTGVDAAGERFSFLYVGHFTDSYLGIVDLDMRRSLTYGQMFASVGTPTPPEESK
jgi:hypothetical protein